MDHDIRSRIKDVAERTSIGDQFERKQQHLKQMLDDGIPYNAAVAESEVMFETGYFERTDDEFERILFGRTRNGHTASPVSSFARDAMSWK
ncbi:hypothetical protein CU102_00405 [Phyllobacterium brassicacearum]|uniref:Uncharacterized protein n=1 Tax=Phyllobacterium brassicacearum TaxID=314235 RepID=A0A2P7BVR0_9HYPH|nr:hypothetical protein CU102_00405 [Phyllobacterium brassicacearum]